jgi:hypothetical protein
MPVFMTDVMVHARPSSYHEALMGGRTESGRRNQVKLVILSEAKDPLATLDPREMILRCAQDDNRFRPYMKLRRSI